MTSCSLTSSSRTSCASLSAAACAAARASSTARSEAGTGSLLVRPVRVLPGYVSAAEVGTHDHHDVGDRADVGRLHGVLADAQRTGDADAERLRLGRCLLDEHPGVGHPEGGV